jgi:hypothetical protein
LIQSSDSECHNNQRQAHKFKSQYRKLFKLRLPHMDTVDRVLRRLPGEALGRLKQRMIQALLAKKALHRLAVKLKKGSPHLPIWITAEGLYPNPGFFEPCQHNDWCFIVTFKDGNLLTVWEEVRALRTITPKCATHRTTGLGSLRDR